MARVIIIGGGMSGLSLAWFLKNRRPGWEVSVLEADARPGGKARTVEEQGFLCETGVNGVLDNKPSTLGLAADLGLSPLRSNDAARRRFVVKDGRLVKLPEAPPEFLTSPLLSPLGRARVMAEALLPKGDLSGDESLADFARRRLGKEAFARLIDPMATGIYAGDPERLSLKSCFPRIHELERDHGSLIRAMLKLKREAKKKGKSGPGAGPGGTLTSFGKGMSELVHALASSLGDTVRLNAPVKTVVRKGDGWGVVSEDGGETEATHVVFACPAGQVSRMLRETAPEISNLIGGVRYPPVAVVCLGLKEASLRRPLDGFGFLCPGGERRRILGVLWDSSIFPGRAPEGYALLRTLVGGARAPEMAEQSDDRLRDMVLEEAGEIMEEKVSPDFVSIFRWKEAIPQYEIGHQSMMERLAGELARNPGLSVCCNWKGGVSLNDCVANAERLAEELASQ
jgi:oxygen-dependent protoporphyrinogen oxidase